MKSLNILVLVSTIGLAQLVSGAEILEQTDDNTAGAAFGGAAGLLVGGAISGGPLGAAIGLAAGVFTGKFAQSKTDLSERAYLVKTDNQQIRKVRSPTQQFQSGDTVIVTGNRINHAN